MAVEFGLALVERHPASKLTQWMEDIEAVVPLIQNSFKSLWMTDHLFWSDLYTYEAWTVLSFLAAKFPQFDVGPMVMGQNYRNPALLAKMASTLQVFSGGRLYLGVGAGWKVDEYAGYGYDYPTPGVRLEQLQDTLEILKRLWTQPGKVSYSGKHYQVKDAYLEPKPVPPPPLVIGVKGDKALRLAAQYGDWWNVSDAPIDVMRTRMALLDQYCTEIGRDPKSLRRTWFGRVVTGQTEADVQRRATSRDTAWTRQNAFVGTPAQVIEQMQEYVALGVDYFMLDIVGQPDADVVQLVSNEIAPRVRG